MNLCVMEKIGLHIVNNDTGSTFRCYISKYRQGWQCIIYQKNFQFQFIKEATLHDCMAVLAKYLAPMNLTLIGEKKDDAGYTAILNSHIRRIRTEKFIEKKKDT